MGAGEVATTGFEFPEGPVVLGESRIAVCEELASRIGVFDGSSVSVLATTGGSPNGATLGSDGKLYVAQNGGVVGEWRADAMITPSIQRVGQDGSVEELATSVAGERLLAPNDICFGPDGRLYFTDPAHGYDPVAKGEGGRIFALGPGRSGEMVVSLGPVYNNGIGFLPNGRLIWVESYDRTVMLLEEQAPRRLSTLPDHHVPDGLAVAEDGRIFIATVFSHGVTVVSPEGDYLGLIELDDGSFPTNCAFEGSALWVTDVGEDYLNRRGAGRLWRVETDAKGIPLHQGSI